MRVDLILHMVHNARKSMIETGNDGLPRGNKLGGAIIGVNIMELNPIDEGAVEISPEL